MKNVSVFFLILALVAISCGKPDKPASQSETKDSLESFQYPVDGKLKFSGVDWNIIENNVSEGLIDNFNLTKINNVFTDSKGRLHLRIAKIDDNWYGAEMVSSFATGLGDCILYLDTNSFPIEASCMVSFGSRMQYDRRFTGLTEAGIRIYGKVIEPPTSIIEYYAYNTEHKFALVEYPQIGTKQLEGNSMHIVSVQSNLLSYATRRGTMLDHSKYLYEYSVNSSSKRTREDEDKIYFSKPSNEMRAFIKFSLAGIESSPSWDTVEIIIPKLDFLSPKDLAEQY